jgi:FAD/FMN-containing dehydrogenase
MTAAIQSNERQTDHSDFLTACRRIVGDGNVLTGEQSTASYTVDWTGKYRGKALAVIRPSTTRDVAQVVKLCAAQDIAIVPQSGNTGICGGGVPSDGQTSVILSLSRMNHIRSIDTGARTATVDAGVILETLQNAVQEHDLIFPLMFGARGSAMIGGNLSTNAGGSNVVRYGNTRDLCLGIEAVLADGSIVNGLTGLRKDNTGYDLKNLLIGAEGTLGIITGAVLKLYPQPKVRATAFLSAASLSAALEILNIVQDRLGNTVEAFEYVPQPVVEIILKHVPQVRQPLADAAEVGILLEVASSRMDDAQEASDGGKALQEGLMIVLADLMETGLVLDAMFATSDSQRAALWKLRESVLESINAHGPAYHLDVALPLSRVADFVRIMDEKAAELGFRPLTIGHLGDGNLHYAISAADPASWDSLPLAQMTEFAFDLLGELNGSFSAEHGIGQSKAALLKARKEPAQVAMMRSIKQALDPKNILNPGKMLI